MFKYSKRTIMKTAHAFFASGRFGNFSVCLKKAWENAKIIKATLDNINADARTYGGWLKLGKEVIHGEKTVGQCIVNSIRYASKTTEILSFFTASQVCDIGAQV